MKKILALLTAITLALSLIAAAPVMATGEEGEAVTPELTIYEQVRKETNLIKNGDLEAEKFNDPEDAASGHFPLRWNNNTQIPEYSISTKESYSGNKSLLAKSTGGYDHIMPFTNGGLREGATYIASVMALGTVANKKHWDVNTLKGGQWEPRFALSIEGRDRVGSPVSIGDDINHLNTAAENRANLLNTIWFPLNKSYKAAASSDTEGARSLKSDWIRTYATMEVKTNKVQALGVGMGITLQNSGIPEAYKEDPTYKYVEIYADDYYIGELMVANIELNNATTVNIPNGGSTVVELDAQAYNQIENTVGLEDVEYTYELVGNPAGAYISGNQLTLTSDAQAGTLKVKVTAEPNFYGADTQEEAGVDVSYRTKIVNFTLTKASDADFYESLRTSSNLLSDANTNLEGTSLWSENNYTSPSNQRSNTYEISTNQAYSGNQSMLVKRTGTYSPESHFPKKSSIVKDKALVFSAMVLGTAANKATCDEYPGTAVKMVPATLSSGYFNSLPTEKYIGETDVKLNTMLDVPSSESTEKVSKDKWQMVHTGAVIDSAYAASRYWSGAGVVFYNSLGSNQVKDLEIFVDDFYMGELIVAKVDAAETVKEAVIGEDAEIELKATAYNQLGTTDYFGENTSYAWSEVSLPEGVEIVGDKLTIANDAEAGKAIINVVCTPDFAGADAQTDAQKAARTTTVIINIIEKPGFEFAAAEGSITATAVVGDLASDAKAYCALYKVLEDGAKKLMGVESKDVVAGGENVAFTAITTPDYDYEIKCFMWYEGTMNDVIPAVVWGN